MRTEERQTAATNTRCGCHVYVDELPLESWSCEHGSFFFTQPRKPAPPDGIIAIS